MIVIQKIISGLLSLRQLPGPDLLMSKLLAAQGAIERFNEGLFVLLVGPRDTMPFRPLMHALGALGFELGPAIGLEHLYPPVAAGC